MKIAISIWDGRVSPVMDTAGQLLVVELDNGQEISRNPAPLPQADVLQRARFINGLGIDMLICGAISRPFEMMLNRLGVRVNPWVRGEADQIIQAYSNGSLQSEIFNLPGCGRGRGRGLRRGRCGQGRGFGRNKFNQEDI